MKKGRLLKILFSVLLVPIVAISSFSIVHADQDYSGYDIGMINCSTFFNAMYNMYPYTVHIDGNTNLQPTESYVDHNNGIWYQCNTTEKMREYLPIMAVGGGANSSTGGGTFTWPRYSAYDGSHRIRVTPDSLYIIFYSSTNFTNDNITAYTNSSSKTVQITRITGDYQTPYSLPGYYLIVLKITANTSGTTYVTIDMPGVANTLIMPIYYGTTGIMDEATYYIATGTQKTYNVSDTQTHTLLNTINSSINSANDHLYGIVQNTNTITLQLTNIRSDLNKIINGNSTTTQSTQNLDDTVDDLNDQISEYNVLEGDLVTDFTDSITDLDTDSELLINSNFLNSAAFFKSTFNTMFSSNPFGWYIRYSLIVGIALLFIGRYKH